MMLSSHVLMGLNLGLAVSIMEPALGGLVITSAIAGSILPDLDMLAEHHKTLHRPYQFLLVSSLLLIIATINPSNTLFTVLFISAAATVHSFADVLSQGKTKNPEIRKDDRAVFNHIKKEWISPGRLITEGSRRDFVLTTLLALPVFYSFSNSFSYLAGFMVVIGGLQYLLLDWFTHEYISEYDRYSEFIQHSLGFGPETTTAGNVEVNTGGIQDSLSST